MSIEVRKKVFGENGFTTELKASSDELKALRSFITEQWLDTLKKASPALAGTFAQLGLERYHEKADQVDHKSLWPKKARILPKSAMESIRKMSFFKTLEAEFGALDIADEEEIGWGEIYWRIVRPNAQDDVGPLHADSWFWNLGHGKMPAGKERVKVWIPVFCEPGLNGLRVVPGSHLKEWKYWGEERDGFVKPQFDEKASGAKAELVRTDPGQMVVFHDKLLHGGAVNRGNKTRISLEMTLLYTAPGSSLRSAQGH